MTSVPDLYNVSVTALAAIGLLYLLYSGRYAVSYRRFYLLITLGLFLSVLGGPLIVTASASARHLIHGTATLFIAVGLYDLLRGELRREDDWERLLLRER